jgi:hypothetical protein
VWIETAQRNLDAKITYEDDERGGRKGISQMGM